MKRIILFVMLFIPSIVVARSKTSCDYTLLANMKKLASNINTTYTYRLIDDYVYFDITLTNIQSDMYIIDKNSKKTYYYKDTNNGVVTLKDYGSGKVNFIIYSNNNDCLKEKLAVKTVNLPFYNSFYNYPECDGIEQYKLCQRWTKYDGTLDNFIKSINNYKSKLSSNNISEEVVTNNLFTRIIKYYVDYFYILIPLTIGFVIGILYLYNFIKNKKNRFDI